MLRRLFTLLSAVLLVLCLHGCIIIPNGEALNTQNRWVGTVGGADSAAPVRVGVSSVDDVRSAIGAPSYERAGGVLLRRYLEYSKYTRTSTIIFLWPLVHGGPVQPWGTRDDGLGLWFGPDGRVQSYETWEDGAGRTPGAQAEWEHRWRHDRGTTGPATGE
jgi:outer membrane protein assembly factor BamE (lipoprotein component of BamABCDE complex)